MYWFLTWEVGWSSSWQVGECIGWCDGRHVDLFIGWLVG